MISAFELFKIGIGPSSSHTMGPMSAAFRFACEIAAGAGPAPARVVATLYGSLAWTGRGHGSDRAVLLGLLGHTPEAIDADEVEAILARFAQTPEIAVGRDRVLPFDPARDIVFDRKTHVDGHPNAMRFEALDSDGAVMCAQLCFSVGGGFVRYEDEPAAHDLRQPPYPFRSAQELIALCDSRAVLPADIVRANEEALNPDLVVDFELARIADAMFACIERGMMRDGDLPGGLKVRRRACALRKSLSGEHGAAASVDPLDWVNVYAMAVNEENAAGGRVVTAPTNGAAGVVPAVLRYARDHRALKDPFFVQTFLLTATAVGALCKMNASISGAEVGCQGEVGAASAMAAAGLAATLGGTARQIENAAEIAMEHHLGMTCDPIGGLVQIPCIERNAFGAVKAINAASLALRGDGHHRVSLDQVIATMRQTGFDMQAKYKETSLGGLALNVTEC